MEQVLGVHQEPSGSFPLVFDSAVRLVHHRPTSEAEQERRLGVEGVVAAGLGCYSEAGERVIAAAVGAVPHETTCWMAVVAEAFPQDGSGSGEEGVRWPSTVAGEGHHDCVRVVVEVGLHGMVVVVADRPFLLLMVVAEAGHLFPFSLRRLHPAFR